jgi:hypothetical protein
VLANVWHADEHVSKQEKRLVSLAAAGASLGERSTLALFSGVNPSIFLHLVYQTYIPSVWIVKGRL